MWEDQRIVARPRYRDLDLGAAVRRSPGADLRDARPRRRRRSREGDPRRQRDAGARAGAARAVGELAVLARRRDRAGVDPDADLPRVPAGRDPADVQGLGRLRAADRVHGPRRRDRGLHVPVARRAPAPEVRHGRDPGDGLPDPRRARGRAGRARPGDGQGAGRALRRGQAAVASTRWRCSTRTSGWRPATAWRASSSTCPSSDRVADRGRWRGGCSTGCASTARTSAPRPSSRRSRICSTRGNGAARQVVVYEANHDLREVMAEIVAATAGVDRSARCRRLGAPAPWSRTGGRFYNRFVSTGGPDLFVICKNCGSEVSPYITECPYCGNRLRKRAPKLDRDGSVRPSASARTPSPPLLAGCAATRSPGSRPIAARMRRSLLVLAESPARDVADRRRRQHAT